MRRDKRPAARIRQFQQNTNKNKYKNAQEARVEAGGPEETWYKHRVKHQTAEDQTETETGKEHWSGTTGWHW